ncbi:tetraspanin-9 [Neodiprion lecontei]|uniref:Tetraspanin-9 n=1 Tax=Neodiprion lecontei TaxID=441921 RepID=A0A6J0B5I7_NEOLC|nr:tetraspanin-9 [Neodiprion lecontei]
MTDSAVAKTEEPHKIRNTLRLQPIRYLNIFFSITLSIYGAGILLITLGVRYEFSGYLVYLHYYLETPILVLFLGSVLLIGIGCLGIISSAQSIYQGIVTFGVLLFGLLMIMLTMLAVAFATLSSARKSIEDILEDHMANYTTYSSDVDYLQANLNCCGFDDFTEWNYTLGYIPGSCCDSDTVCEFADVKSLDLEGCYDALEDLVTCTINFFMLVLGILALIEVITIALTYFLARAIGDRRRRVLPSEEPAESETLEVVNNPLAVGRTLPRVKPISKNIRNGSPNPEKRFNQQVGQRPFIENYPRLPSHKNTGFYARTIVPSAPPQHIVERQNPKIF